MQKKKEGTKGPHLTYEERVQIEGFVGQDYSYAEIGAAIGRSKPAVGREVKENGGSAYNAKKAHAKARLKQKRKKRSCIKVALSRFLTRFVERTLRLGWSPERIASRLKFLHGIRSESEYASAKSIRKYVRGRSGLESFLYGNRHKKKSGPKRGSWLKDTTRRFVNAMPALPGFGTFEVDFIVSSYSSFVLLVIVDVATKLTLLRILPRRVNAEVNAAVIEMVAPYHPARLVPDNDIAFGLWKELETATGAEICFARPFCSTDKPLVENTNKWTRFHAGMPKKTDIETVSPDRIALLQEWFNHTPRECLGGKTPWEAYQYEKNSCVMIEETYPRHPVLSPLQGLPSLFGGRGTLFYRAQTYDHRITFATAGATRLSNISGTIFCTVGLGTRLAIALAALIFILSVRRDTL